MKGTALMACIAVGLVGVSLLLVYPSLGSGPEPELRDPPRYFSECELVKKFEPNQPLRGLICHPSLNSKARERLEEQHGVGEPEGIEEQQRVREPEVTIEL